MSKYTDFIGSASQMDEIVFFNDDENVVTLDDGRVYLRGGILETNLTTYPDARNSFRYLGTSFSVASENASFSGITFDGNYFWAIGTATDTVYKYNSAGVYQNVSFSVASQDSNPKGITFDGNYLWVVGDSSDRVYKYNTAGVYQGISFSSYSQSRYPKDIAWDGNYFWVLAIEADSGLAIISKYNSAGVYQNEFYFTYQNTSATSITWDGTSLWVADLWYSGGRGPTAYKYNTSGVYQAASFYLGDQGSRLTGIAWDGTSFWVLDGGYQATDAVYKYSPAIGIASDTSFGAHNYVRVK